MIVSTQEQKKKNDRGFRLHLKARLRLLKRSLFSSSEEKTPKPQNPSAGKGKNVSGRTRTERKSTDRPRNASAGKKNAPARTAEPRSASEKAKPARTRTASASPAKKTVKRTAPPPMPEIVEAPQEEGKTRFTDLPLAKEILAAVQTLGFRYCTPIQALCLPAALEGRDLAAKAQTGTGRTAAF
ncbi:MAG: hypothetical protein J5806_14420, partial [Lentisphaeria bacterium]|nr:hypothetical protein [Lentisphaeria bacterium]